MRIVIDMQGAQSESRYRGIGRLTLALAQAIARERGQHEVLLALNGLFPNSIEPIRATFNGLIPQENIRVWYAPGPTREVDPSNQRRREIAECIREGFLLSLQPDAVLLPSLFEGLGDDAITSIGAFDAQTPTMVILHDLIPLTNPDAHFRSEKIHQEYYKRKIAWLRRSRGLLSVSDSSRNEALSTGWFSEQNVVTISEACDEFFRVLNLSPSEKQMLAIRLGISRPFVMYTGGADERKNLPLLIEAYAGLPWSLRRAHQLLFVGKMPENSITTLRQVAKANRLGKNELVFTGYVDDADLIKLYNSCQLFVFPSLHEGFGLPPLEAMACGAPVIAANATSLPEVIGRMEAMFDPRSAESIRAKMDQALSDEGFRSALAQNGLIEATRFSWDQSARRALGALQVFVSNSAQGSASFVPVVSRKCVTDRLLASIATFDGKLDEQETLAIARSVATSIPSSRTKRRLFVDVSELIHGDAKTGIQRVVRGILRELYESPPSDYAVKLVYAVVGRIGYFYANKFSLAFFEQEKFRDVADEAIEFEAGDIFLGLDLQPVVIPAQEEYLQNMRSYGVKVVFVVYDLLCTSMPQYFPIVTAKAFSKWLPVIAEADGVLCISKAVTEELEKWIRNFTSQRSRPFKIGYFHIGADFENSNPTLGLPSEAADVLCALGSRPSFLMVGTLEPRKGHTQSLDAFERLWAEGLDVNLVLVGKCGWNVGTLAKRLHNHPEFGKRLVWLEGISDEFLGKVYIACSCLIAASEGEGFGLPLIEAARHKLPIIARDIPVFKEVAGSNAFYFCGLEAVQLADAVKQWLVLFHEHRQPVSDNLKWLTWKQSAQQLVDSLVSL